jgi:hypothetical protein
MGNRFRRSATVAATACGHTCEGMWPEGGDGWANQNQEGDEFQDEFLQSSQFHKAHCDAISEAHIKPKMRPALPKTQA